MNSINKIDVVKKLTAEMKKVVDIQLSNQTPPASNNDEMRRNYENERKFWNEGGAEVFKTHEFHLNFEDTNVRTRIYYPSQKDNYKVIFFIHGGGYVVGSIDTHDRMMRILASLTDCAVVGVDYTLAPDKKFPFQIQQSDAVLDHLLQNHEIYKLDTNYITFAGDSAGANMCMGLFLYRRKFNKNISTIRAMLLYYGLFGLKDSVSRSLYGNEIDWLREEDMKYYFNEYLADPSDEESEFVNIFNADLTSNVPPCFIGACEFDPLRDDSAALYEILREHNNSQYKEYKGVMHAFLHFTKIMQEANVALQDGAKFLNENFKIL